MLYFYLVSIGQVFRKDAAIQYIIYRERNESLHGTTPSVVAQWELQEEGLPIAGSLNSIPVQRIHSE